MTAQASPAQNAAYRAGLCIGLCGRRYSAGRNRCDACFEIWWNDTTTRGEDARIQTA